MAVRTAVAEREAGACRDASAEAAPAENAKGTIAWRVPIIRHVPGPDLAFVGLLVAVLALVGLFATAVSNDLGRHWLGGHADWVLVGSADLVALATVAAVVWRTRGRGPEVRVAALVLIAAPAILLAMGSAWYIASPLWRVNVIRTMIDVIFLITPAVMWWLFISSRRASLLNEFLANIQRLGLLEQRESLAETPAARATRIDSYLQKFEGTYGRVPRHVHCDVLDDRVRPYSREEVRAQSPISIGAVPVVLTLLVLAIGWMLTLSPADDTTTPGANPWQQALKLNATPVTFAFLGAYFFSLQMLFRRYVRSDLRGSAYVAVVMRILLALIGIWVLQEIATAPASWWHPSDWWHPSHFELLLLGFVIGVFPVVAWQIIRNLAAKVFRYALPTLQAEIGLNYLDGLTVWHEARLEEEDIENVPNMATADVVSLLVCTRFPADRIIDWVDQAILLTYLGPVDVRDSGYNGVRQSLARHGIRTASALLATAEAMEPDFFNAMAVDRNGRSVVPTLLASISTSSNLALVLRWRGNSYGALDSTQPRRSIALERILSTTGAPDPVSQMNGKGKQRC